MKLRTLTLSKEFKKGLPNYSNITVGMEMTFDIPEGEKANLDEGWDTINRELNNQTDTDASWMKSDDLKDDYKLTIKTKKNVRGGEDNG